MLTDCVFVFILGAFFEGLIVWVAMRPQFYQYTYPNEHHRTIVAKIFVTLKSVIM